MIQNEYTTDEWRILTAVVLEGYIEYKKNELEKELRAHKNALQVGMNIKIEVHILSQYMKIIHPKKARGQCEHCQANTSNFDKTEYFAKIEKWFDRMEKPLDLETKRLAAVRRAHTSLFR